MALSLRLRLLVLPALVVLAGLAALVLLEARDARGRIRAETQSGIQLGRVIAQSAIAHAERAATPEEAMAELSRELPPAVRHLRLTLEGPTARPSPPAPEPRAAPAWFVRWIDADPVVERFAVTYGGARLGTVILTSTPGDEIAEVWADWRNDVALLTAVSLAIILLVLVAVSQALRPLSSLVHAFDRMEEGDFAVRVGSSADPQLRRLAERYNRLAASLDQATSDNKRLMDRLVSVQEAERKHIAHELHDEFGPSLFAIRADLGAISRWVRKKEPRFAEIQERLLSISELVAQIQRINTRLLERLRPLVLDQMGLSEALERLIDDWRHRYPKLSFTTDIEPVSDPGESAVNALYRAAQECLTNIVRHANARSVEVRLTGDRDRVCLVVTDDGKGIAPGTPQGFGLLGMAERAKAAGGRLDVRPAEGGGTRIEVQVRARGGRR